MSLEPRRRKVTVHIRARDANDPKVILDEVLKTLQEKKVEVTIAVDQASITGSPEPPPPTVPDEQLETEIKDTADAKLEEQNHQADAANPTAAPDAQKADEAKRSIWRRMGVIAAKGWRITVHAALEWGLKKVGS